MNGYPLANKIVFDKKRIAWGEHSSVFISKRQNPAETTSIYVQAPVKD
jgi:hypothetical protein